VIGLIIDEIQEIFRYQQTYTWEIDHLKEAAERYKFEEKDGPKGLCKLLM